LRREGAYLVRILRRAFIAVVGFVFVALLVDGVVGVVQPALEPGDAEGTLRVWGDDGEMHETRLVVIEDEGTLWVQSGHHFRGWYERLLERPAVELERGGEVRQYHAVALDNREAKEHMRALLKRRTGVVGFYAIRTFLLFADIKPVRLDPR
jgi:hypothetical protein